MTDKKVKASGKGSSRNGTVSPSKVGRIILPKSNGVWENETKRGECKWYPGVSKDGSPVTNPSKSNPNDESWDDIKKKYGFEYIEFKGKEPDFKPFSRGNVTFKKGQYTSNRDKNFNMADKMLAAQLTTSKGRKVTPKEVAEWREANGYTWHEERNCQNLRKIPSVINNNIPHSGGIAAKKAKEKRSSDI
ncbi:MAG: HNH endonuclease [Paludibacteraceae bacterium]|nr:HNH endonuclease [Paludibacteraceae bacterium]